MQEEEEEEEEQMPLAAEYKRINVLTDGLFPSQQCKECQERKGKNVHPKDRRFHVRQQGCQRGQGKGR